MSGVTLFHVSDIHFGIEDDAAHRWFAEAVERERPDAVICTGDITQRSRQREWQAACEWLAALPAPVVTEVGNHDMPYYNLAERFLAPFKRYERLAASLGDWPMLPGIHLVPLRTTVRAQGRFPWSDGVVTGPALDAAVKRAHGGREGDIRLVFGHHPLMAGPMGSHNPTIHGDEAFSALAAAGADVILSGHVHDPFDLTFEANGRKVRMIGAGTLSRRLRKARPSYNVLCFDAGLQVEARVFSEI
jgi:3',5'-cyclic AMP phosphodiesterase CpdA